MYECVICFGFNHSRRTHCQFCGAIPSQYSITGKVIVYCDNALNRILPIAAAMSCVRQTRYKAARAYFRTVPLDYYAS